MLLTDCRVTLSKRGDTVKIACESSEHAEAIFGVLESAGGDPGTLDFGCDEMSWPPEEPTNGTCQLRHEERGG